jgi:DNA helicase-2/ATP-dependent DNA helicase PcrA
MRLPDNNGCVLIIGDSVNPKCQSLFASQTPGAITVEAVEMRDLISFAQNLDLNSTDALASIIQFAQSVMTNVGASNLIQRIQSLRRGTAHNPPTAIERVALTFVQSPSHRAAEDLLVAISNGNSVRAHRPTVLRACIKALHLCSGTAGLSFNEAVLLVREQYRLVGRPLPRRAVGSTLLLKGLEADAVVILNADKLDIRNLYVAITRGSRALTVCSRTPLLNPMR